MGHAPSRPRRRLPVDERRQLLISAAQQLFSQRSVDDVSVDDIAAESGASRALLYHYFDSKQDLYVAALRQAADELIERVTATRDTGTPADQLARGITAYVDYAEDYATGFLTLLRGGPGVSAGEVGEVVQSVRDSLLAGLLEGFEVATAPPMLRTALRSWIAVAETVVLDWLERRDVSRAQLESFLLLAFPGLHGAAVGVDGDVPPLPA